MASTTAAVVTDCVLKRISEARLRGYVTDGLRRALEWHSRGQWFDPAYLHQRVRKRLVFVRKQAFSLFYDEIGISLPSQSLPRGGVPCERPPFFVSQVGTNLNWKNMSHQSFHNSNTSYSGGLIKSCATFFIMSI